MQAKVYPIDVKVLIAFQKNGNMYENFFKGKNASKIS